MNGWQEALRRQWFLVGMLSAVGLAALTPEWGRTGGHLHGEWWSKAGIALVFFLHGLGMSFQAMKSGLSRWQVHVFVQLCTFGLFPLLWWLLSRLFGPWVPAGLDLGFVYLCALPSTITSSVAMTVIARGNVPAAIFNASLSGLLAIPLTPLIVAAFTGMQGQGLSLVDAMLGISRLLLLPLVLGQVLRPLLHGFHQRYKGRISLLDRWVILFIVYSAFCDSAASGIWQGQGLSVLMMAFLGAALILAMVLALATALVRHLGFPREDEIASVFCGSKKSMATGVPMVKLLFGVTPHLGLILLPVLLYHQLQMFACAVLANRYAQSGPAKTEG